MTDRENLLEWRNSRTEVILELSEEIFRQHPDHVRIGWPSPDMASVHAGVVLDLGKIAEVIMEALGHGRP